MLCRHMSSHAGIGGSGAGFGGGTGTTRKAAFMGQARGTLLHVVHAQTEVQGLSGIACATLLSGKHMTALS